MKIKNHLDLLKTKLTIKHIEYINKSNGLTLFHWINESHDLTLDLLCRKFYSQSGIRLIDSLAHRKTYLITDLILN